MAALPGRRMILSDMLCRLLARPCDAGVRIVGSSVADNVVCVRAAVCPTCLVAREVQLLLLSGARRGRHEQKRRHTCVRAWTAGYALHGRMPRIGVECRIVSSAFRRAWRAHLIAKQRPLLVWILAMCADAEEYGCEWLWA